MGLELITEADLAEILRISKRRCQELRIANGWPHVRLSRTDIRYTPEQIEQVISLMTRRPVRPSTKTDVLAGQTKRSAARSGR